MARLRLTYQQQYPWDPNDIVEQVPTAVMRLLQDSDPARAANLPNVDVEVDEAYTADSDVYMTRCGFQRINTQVLPEE